MSTEAPATQERTIIEVEYGKRTWGFHREPEMSMHEWGYVTVDWPLTVEHPVVVYYKQGETSKTPHTLEIQNAFSEWEVGNTNTPQIKGNKNAIIPVWSEELNPETGELTISSKSVNQAIIDLVVKAKPVLIENPSMEELGLK
ncbi:hypothetical protein A3A54_00215 [Candidatus Curtissbacteria bacterium RIFCSPLOWO2_01_FULL_39_62]|uniref:Uncharacterized protein n=2 Tax=Candidatus Curtissiibacteriota TaxID=1752717 RepID=A0A1F5GAP2_9BACT|nr:MAG: hypothetical protein A2775_00865 [Candidatus Curtissbacteria bacterium RIFCSPHIGHO2_01_FULL_39_57]OGD88941.1 MAG: hypothetical protein A3D04_01965 [Candidatus Curtissbacteria bacterium RIFCSPHIGHO2_02_FULL_40_16b]OGD90691.1 MAG: hypothetical protein A3E11_00960 [Candidatus Curtissbacteria bacterium RIFCSPHIGHO2_12_FULL_38_37]OGE00720.1 MAG: hypothetical protein A3J17_04170 [Candidatus Curtissbacteria bacterium RIFCSPLOWO2_02_FULL_40_11]OGE02440.1 MAG: hypothetical protein A3A54_00215 [C